jgi:hypothetical protein
MNARWELAGIAVGLAMAALVLGLVVVLQMLLALA